MQLRRLQDPYTPESVESHSPQPELDELEFSILNETAESDEIFEILSKHKANEIEQANGELKENLEENVANLQTHYNMTHTVSPSQLTTRLEILRRESQLMINESGSKSSGSGSGADVDDKKSLNKSKCCFRCSCVIL